MSKNFDRLVEIMATLRAPGGCPWDAEQTHETLKPYLLEETHEVIEAIDSGDKDNLRGELGDLLLQVVFHAQIASEKSEYNVDDVCDYISEKLIRRHPHVFGESDADTPDKVIKQWEEIKRKEKGHEERSSVLDGVPNTLPSLSRALKLSKKASRAGFDWDDVDGAFEKLDEELFEFREAFAKRDVSDMEDELGDVLFSLVNIARFIEVNPEEALRKTIGKFIRRFNHLEARIAEQNKTLNSVDLDEMETYWNEAKENE